MSPTGASWLTWQLVRRVVLVVVLLLVGYFLVTLFQVWRTADDDDRTKTQAIIVLGAAQYDGRPTEVFRARLDHAVELWREGVAPTIVVTGGKQAGDRFTEAGAGADYLHRFGVPDDQIIRETTSRNSWESLAASARILQNRGIEKVTLVSDPFHMLRIRRIAEELGFEAHTSPTRSSPISGVDEWLRYASEALRVAFGQVFGFGRLARAARVGIIGS
ncbi:MAG: YdcF family protein [Acidimicrobiia bacterium]